MGAGEAHTDNRPDFSLAPAGEGNVCGSLYFCLTQFESSFFGPSLIFLARS